MKDREIRRAAFAWLDEQVDLHGYSLPRRPLLEDGFEYDGQSVHLLGPKGIFKPRDMILPLSITTVVGGPYNDAFRPDGLLNYKYRGRDPQHPDNVGLRECMREQVPLIYFHGIEASRYVPSWPVFIVKDDPGALSFAVAVDDELSLRKLEELPVGSSIHGESAIRRGYVTSLVRRRIHQQAFRERVLAAYRRQCALCHLKHTALLDAAHIVPDSDEEGEPVISNGVALCKLHHAAFDKHFLAIRPDYVVEIRSDLLTETDGPMLKHGLQGLHGQVIILPTSNKDRPNQEFLERRYKKFRTGISIDTA